MMTLEQFLVRADEVATSRGWKRSTLSQKLFGSGTRLDQLHAGADVATRRFSKAVQALEEIERAAEAA